MGYIAWHQPITPSSVMFEAVQMIPLCSSFYNEHSRVSSDSNACRIQVISLTRSGAVLLAEVDSLIAMDGVLSDDPATRTAIGTADARNPAVREGHMASLSLSEDLSKCVGRVMRLQQVCIRVSAAAEFSRLLLSATYNFSHTIDPIRPHQPQRGGHSD